MKDAEFERRYADTLRRIEDALDASAADLDYETVNDILSIHCADGSAIIITRQGALRQLWLAARSGGFHLDWDEERGDWLYNGGGQTLGELLGRVLREQAGVTLEL